MRGWAGDGARLWCAINTTAASHCTSHHHSCRPPEPAQALTLRDGMQRPQLDGSVGPRCRPGQSWRVKAVKARQVGQALVVDQRSGGVEPAAAHTALPLQPDRGSREAGLAHRRRPAPRVRACLRAFTCACLQSGPGCSARRLLLQLLTGQPQQDWRRMVLPGCSDTAVHVRPLLHMPQGPMHTQGPQRAHAGPPPPCPAQLTHSHWRRRSPSHPSQTHIGARGSHNTIAVDRILLQKVPHLLQARAGCAARTAQHSTAERGKVSWRGGEAGACLR